MHLCQFLVVNTEEANLEDVCLLVNLLNVLQRLGAGLALVVEDDGHKRVGLDNADQEVGVNILYLVRNGHVVLVCQEVKHRLLVLQVSVIDHDVSSSEE